MSLATPKHVERRQAASFMGGSATLPTFSTAPASRRRVDTLRVRVLSGTDLKDDMDVTGAGDPYVVLGVDDGPTQKTSACACTANPSWGDGELFEFELPSDDCELRLQVWDADLVGSDDEMGDGSMRVSLQQLALIGSFYVNVRISLGGTIRLQARARARNSAAQFGGGAIRRANSAARASDAIHSSGGRRASSRGRSARRRSRRCGCSAAGGRTRRARSSARSGCSARCDATPRNSVRYPARTSLTAHPSHLDRSPRRSG